MPAVVKIGDADATEVITLGVDLNSTLAPKLNWVLKRGIKAS